MGALNKPNQECFAAALARGISVREAANQAGFDGRHIGRVTTLAASKPIARRVVEIRREALWGGRVELADVFDTLMRLARAAGALKTGAGMAAAKALLAEAASLMERATMALDENGDLPPRLSKEEWIAAFAPKT